MLCSYVEETGLARYRSSFTLLPPPCLSWHAHIKYMSMTKQQMEWGKGELIIIIISVWKSPQKNMSKRSCVGKVSSGKEMRDIHFDRYISLLITTNGKQKTGISPIFYMILVVVNQRGMPWIHLVDNWCGLSQIIPIIRQLMELSNRIECLH